MCFESGTRVVIAPYGLPAAAAAREACCRILLGCGGDLRRVIEGAAGEPAAIAARLPPSGPVDFAYAPLVVLSQTKPLVLCVMRLRKVMEMAAPQLERAPWFVFHDPQAHPEFLETATALGAIDADLEFAPFWYAPDNRTYLVISPRVAAVRFVRARVRLLADATRENTAFETTPASRVRVVQEQPSSARRRGGKA